MTAAERKLLDALRDGIRGRQLEETRLSEVEWMALLRIAEEQEVLPLVYDTIFGCSSFHSLDQEQRNLYREKSLKLAVRQTIQTNEFLTLILQAQAQGLDPVVLKGVTVRSLYPKPMLRPSVDEDLLIPRNTAEQYHRFFLSEGLDPDDPAAELFSSAELSYHKPGSPTYIELHNMLFPARSEAYGDCNRLFEEALDRSKRIQVEDVSIRVLAPTDHLLYLICHAYKHFLHSGVGIRQVCDMAMLVEHYGDEIDWTRIVQGCASIRIDFFAAALFRIAEQYLGFSLPDAFSAYEADTGPLLEDMLSGGLYGIVDEDRLHSGSITLDAVAAQKQGRGRRGLRASLFPSAASLSGRYSYLRGRPWLLPLAWAQRAAGYLKKRKANAAATVRIGDRRVELLKQYRIIDW